MTSVSWGITAQAMLQLRWMYSVGLSTQTLDTIVPTSPSSLTATSTSSSQINLSWTASTDNIGVTGYQIERCQGAGCTAFSQIATASATTYSNTGLSASTSYSYRTRATDAAGNVSGYSNTASASTQAFTVKLTIEIAGTGSGVVSGDGTYLVGTEVVITATPNAGSSFAGWSGNSDCTDGLVTMNENKTCKATFNKGTVGIGGGPKAYWEEYLASYPGASNIQRTPNNLLGYDENPDGTTRGGYFTPDGMIRGEGWWKDPVSWTDKYVDGLPNKSCRLEVYHPRRHIGTLRPGHNMGVGVGTELGRNGNATPKYFTSGLSGGQTFVWYMDTGILTDAVQTFGSCTSKKVRKIVWPGEVTDDGWAVIPTSADPNTAKFIFVVPANVDPNTVTIRDLKNGTALPLPYYEGGIPFIGPNTVTNCPFDECYTVVLGGGGGPEPTFGDTIPNSEGRAKYEQFSDTTIRIYITGWRTGTNPENDDNYSNQLASGSSDPVAEAVADFIRSLGTRASNVRIEIYAHSLGAAEATWIYQNGTGLRAGDKIIALATPFFVEANNMVDGRNGVQYHAYCESADIVCTGLVFTKATVGRSPNETIIVTTLKDLPAGTTSYNAHDRKLYQRIIGLPNF
ncbi:MAG: fibronectin type III domain-containing protein [Nitrospirae bacterium]|nr:fibronectin type III domain-containing protein [Candidatus Troglogloeales bacterium]